MSNFTKLERKQLKEETYVWMALHLSELPEGVTVMGMLKAIEAHPDGIPGPLWDTPVPGGEKACKHERYHAVSHALQRLSNEGKIMPAEGKRGKSNRKVWLPLE